MNLLALSIAVVVVLPAAALVAWVGLVMATANDELRSFVDFEGIHFDESP